ncbi:9188_t:CDS:1, partial [Scutellospora calospora]
PKLLATYFAPFRLITGFCTQVWSSEQLIGEIKKTPILFLTGGNDKVVPQEHTKILYELTKTEGGKVWEKFPKGKHSDTISQPGFFEAIEIFLSKVTQK